MKTDLSIKKRTGQIEGLDIQKIHKVVNFACEGLAGVSSSLVQMNAGIQFSDGMTTKEIQDLLVHLVGQRMKPGCVHLPIDSNRERKQRAYPRCVTALDNFVAVLF